MIGVYAIINKANGKMYIGESINILLRWKFHKEELNKGTHHSYKLQQDWNEYGAGNFTFKIIEKFTLPKDTTFDRSKLNISLLCREYYHMKLNHAISQGYNIECTLQDLYYGKSKDKEKQEYYGNNLHQIVKNNQWLFKESFDINRIIEFITDTSDSKDTMIIKSKTKKPKINTLAFSKVSGYFKETYNISFTKKEFLALLSKWGYIENCYIEKYDSCRWCPTEKGLLSGDIIQKRSALYLTQQGLEKVINYLKDYYYII